MRTLADHVRSGRSIVPLLGAGISIEAGMPPLSEVTQYLAKVKVYLRQRLFQVRPVVRSGESKTRALDGWPLHGSPLVAPWAHLRYFGWPDRHDLNAQVWHWLLSTADSQLDDRSRLDSYLNREIFDTLAQIDGDFVRSVVRMDRKPEKWRLAGKYWKLLLTHLTRASPDLIDALFHQLTRRGRPGVSHRFLALLSPILRLRLILTINFDSLIEDALRMEGIRPTVFEVAEGLSLPYPKLTQSGLSVVKLHGGAFGLMVGDRLDIPLDEETRQRFASYLPDRALLLVIGVGGWDHRVLDMAELVMSTGGEVFWMHFEPERPRSLDERFASRAALRCFHVQDPGAFLRELYHELTGAHPSSVVPLRAFHTPPILPAAPTSDEAAEAQARDRVLGEPVVTFKDQRGDFGLGASARLARFVAEKSKTHRTIWVDVETKFTVEDVVVEIIQQLRRYDPELPPEIVAFELVVTKNQPRILGTRPRYRKLIRRMYAALARGRYVVAFNAVASFGRRPLRHHAYELAAAEGEGTAIEQGKFAEFIEQLLSFLHPQEAASEAGERAAFRHLECLGLLDSVFAFSLDAIDETGGSEAKASCARRSYEERIDQGLRPTVVDLASVFGEPYVARPSELQTSWHEHPGLVLLAGFRRRRDVVALHRLLPKYLALRPGVEPPTAVATEVTRFLEQLERRRLVARLEGGDYWMARRLRNSFYERILAAAMPEHDAPVVDRIRALATLAFVHRDIAIYYQRERFASCHDADVLLEALYHRIASLRFFVMLESCCAPICRLTPDLVEVIRALEQPVSVGRSVGSPRASAENEASWWTGTRSLLEDDHLDRRVMTERRLRSLRSFRRHLAQESETLVTRVPGQALLVWIDQLRREDLKLITHSSAAKDPLRYEMRAEKARLYELLFDLEVAVRRQRLELRDTIRLRRMELRWWLYARWPRRVPRPSSEPTLDWRIDRGPEPASPSVELLAVLGAEVVEARPRLIGGLLDASVAYRRSQWRYVEARAASRRFANAAHELLERWRRSDVAAGGPQQSALLALYVRFLMVTSENALWGQSPWDVKGKPLAAHRRQLSRAQRALQACDRGLMILEDITDASVRARAYLYSLKGRALYMCGRFNDAYRQFDLSRASSAQASQADKQQAGIALLRQTECLMLHADAELTGWACGAIERCLDGAEVKCETFLSWAGRAKQRAPARPEDSGMPPDDEARELIGLSLGNLVAPVLERLEHDLQGIASTGAGSVGSLDPRPRKQAARARLLAARDLLTRAESLLDEGPRSLEWWACLFQLKAQLAVEELLLLLAGEPDLRAAGAPPALQDPLATTASLGSWLRRRRWRKETQDRRAIWRSSVDGSVGATGDPTSERSRRRFVSRFQELLLEGLRAVRRGLDLLLPGDEARENESRLRYDVLLSRKLRLWVELMVCGAFLHDLGLRDRSAGEADRSRRWHQWRYLNQLCGIVILPTCKPLERWFIALEEPWSIDGPPSLAARATAIDRIDRCLSSGPQGGDAIRHLLASLTKSA